MEKSCRKFKDEEISRFVDDELPRDRYDNLADHQAHCKYCRQTIEHYRTMAAVFSHHADQQILKMDPSRTRQAVAQAIQERKIKPSGPVSGFFGKNIYLKLASIAAILMISLFTVQTGLLGGSVPSAIVQSVDTEFSSVMIIETQKEKHTIIWFSET